MDVIVNELKALDTIREEPNPITNSPIQAVNKPESAGGGWRPSGKICGDTMQRAFLEWAYAKFEVDKLSQPTTSPPPIQLTIQPTTSPPPIQLTTSPPPIQLTTSPPPIQPTMITSLPRLTIVVQWDLRGVEMNPGESSCQWDGENLTYCRDCTLQITTGRLLEAGRGQGWQVNRFLTALRSFRIQDDERDWTESPAAEGHPLLTSILREGPSAPPMYPPLGAEGEGGDRLRRGWEPPYPTLLEDTIRRTWPYRMAGIQAAVLPLAAVQVSPVMRVYQDPKAPGYTSGWDRLSDEDRDRAQEKG
ncbi:hypothetical protein PAMA_006571 [Pampus argenteus]